ncbi:MAG: hypothetical protein JXC36_01010 [Candidatus Atribacteria bacterium]|nr:hypothetical protein [Candidatus Atribacteria bacterium]
MPIEDIKERILKDAQLQKEEVIKDAKINIENMKKLFLKDIEIEKQKILKNYEQEAELKEKNIITEAKLKTSKDLLNVKQSIINEIFSEAANRIKNLDDHHYLYFLRTLILDNVENGNETIYISDRERKIINQEFIESINESLRSKDKKGELKLSKKYKPIQGGVIIESNEISKNASFEIIFEKIKEDTEIKLNKLLFLGNEA